MTLPRLLPQTTQNDPLMLKGWPACEITAVMNRFRQIVTIMSTVQKECGSSQVAQQLQYDA